jgi:hypothetical protein
MRTRHAGGSGFDTARQIKKRSRNHDPVMMAAAAALVAGIGRC